MKRRDFLRLVAAMATANALPAYAQQTGVKRLGLMMPLAENDPDAQLYLNAIREGLGSSGWQEGKNLAIDYRWLADTDEHATTLAREILAREPDIILALGPEAAVAASRLTRSKPIIFGPISDPVGRGLVTGIGRPGGNASGFRIVESNNGGRYIALLKEVEPKLQFAGMISASDTDAQYASFEAAATAAGMRAQRYVSRTVEEALGAISDIAAHPPGGAAISGGLDRHRAAIIAEVAKHRLPAVYELVTFVTSGGLISFGIDVFGGTRDAAAYAALVLGGTAPSSLPVQSVRSVYLAANLKTAKELGISLPQSLLTRAELVIQ